MAEITRNTPPPLSLLFAIAATGLVIATMSRKGWFYDLEIGRTMFSLAMGWVIARNWYLRKCD